MSAQCTLHIHIDTHMCIYSVLPLYLSVREVHATVYWLKSIFPPTCDTIVEVDNTTFHPLLKISLIPVNVKRGSVIVKAWVQRSHRGNISLWVSISVGFCPHRFFNIRWSNLNSKYTKKEEVQVKTFMEVRPQSKRSQAPKKKSPSGQPLLS